MKELFDQVSIKCSRATTTTYSTSFSLGIRCMNKELRDPIYAIYGFVRFADEIVDSLHDYDKKDLLARFKKDTYAAIDEGISLNPILNSFQSTVTRYNIDKELIDLFLQSMEMDLSKKRYDPATYDTYILGSAEVVGLMCLKVFCNGDPRLYHKLKPNAMSLGSAFQKINFLRDMQQDFNMGRIYFPNLLNGSLNEKEKRQIEEDIAREFAHGYEGIKSLPHGARFGVYLAYVYYAALFKKIKNMPSERIMQSRIRIKNRHKATLLAYSFFRYQFNLL